MQDLKIALIQADLAWEADDANCDRFREKIDRVPSGTHLIVLPEMFSTGFSMDARRLAQPMDGTTVSWMKACSRQTQADVVGSVIICDEDRYYNRLIWAKPDDTLHVYDKKHLFRYAGEDAVYSPGIRHLQVKCNGWRIRPFICYDLRFPVWTRNMGNVYDAAIFIANWPQRRAEHWRTLLRARAIENQCYVAGVNRVGVDGNGYRYCGDTSIVDPMGQVIKSVRDEEAIINGTFRATTLNEYRSKFPALMDADEGMISM